MSKKKNPLVAFALAPAIIFSACNSTQSLTQTSAEPSHWAKVSAEHIQEVPQRDSLDIAPLATPNIALDNMVSTPLGAPRNLTLPLNQGTQPAKESKTGGGSSDNGSSTGQASAVTINLNTNQKEPISGPVEPLSQSQLEELYQGGFERSADRNLEQFGYSFLQTQNANSQSTGPVPANYIVGPEDELIVTLSGGVDAYHRLTVDRNGLLHIPDFGPVAVAGQTFAEVDESILSFLNERRIGFQLTVSMGRLRSIRVNIVGQVQNPGTVEIPAFSNPIQALGAAGGPLKSGTLRKIRLIRAGAQSAAFETVDLYDYLNSAADAPIPYYIQDGDTLLVPAIGPTIGIAGYVKRPAIYELLDQSLTVADALSLAGGLTAFSFTPLAHIEKTVEGRGRKRIGVNLNSEGLTATMSDGELLLVEGIDGGRQPLVKIEGEVSRPGDYEFQPGMTLSDLIGRADGLTIDAYLPQALISRQLGEAVAIEDVVGRSGHKRSRRIIVSNLSEAMTGNEIHDIALMPLDLITIRSRQEAAPRPIVEIIGSVKNPGAYELTAGMRVSDLVAIAGNPNQAAYYDEAELIRKVFDETTRRIDAKRYRFSLRSALLDEDDTSDPVLVTGDRLIIRSLQEAQVRARVEGFVRFPGEYVFPAGARISDLIAAAGGILDEADLRAASFVRKSTQDLQRQRIKHLEERTRRLFELALEKMVQTGHAREGIAANISLAQSMNTVDRIFQQEADGRIVIPFDRQDFPNSEFNLELENGDYLKIPRKHSTISVAGHVFRPISLVATGPIDIAEALDQAGGLTETADKKQLYVIRADGSVKSVAQKKSPLKKNDSLLPGDVLLAPQKAVERAFGAQLSDALALAKQAAELGLISASIGNDTDFTIVNPSDAPSFTEAEDIFLKQLQ